MSANLLSHLNLVSNRFFLLTNTDTSGPSFGINTFLHHYAEKKRPILCLLLANSWNHYSMVAAKCVGRVSLKKLREENVIKVLDVLVDEDDFEWNKLRDELIKQSQELDEDGLVLIDDLSILLSLGVQDKLIYNLIKDLHLICSSRNHILTVATHFPHNEDDVEDEELNKLVSSIGHECDIWIDIDKTRTGFSSQIDGTLKIHDLNENLSKTFKEFQYKYADRNVKLIL